MHSFVGVELSLQHRQKCCTKLLPLPDNAKFAQSPRLHPQCDHIVNTQICETLLTDLSWGHFMQIESTEQNSHSILTTKTKPSFNVASCQHDMWSKVAAITLQIFFINPLLRDVKDWFHGFWGYSVPNLGLTLCYTTQCTWLHYVRFESPPHPPSPPHTHAHTI